MLSSYMILDNYFKYCHLYDYLFMLFMQYEMFFLLISIEKVYSRYRFDWENCVLFLCNFNMKWVWKCAWTHVKNYRINNYFISSFDY